MNIKEYDVKDLVKADYNPRVISDKQFEELKESISKFGLTEPILINIHKSRKNVVISGHQRLDACISLGIKKVPCVEVNLSEEAEKELNIKMNKLGGEFDFDLLEAFFEKQNLIEWGFEEFEFKIAEEFNTFEPNVSPEQSQKDVSEADIEKKKEELDTQFQVDGQKKTHNIVCPHCLENFDIKI